MTLTRLVRQLARTGTGGGEEFGRFSSPVPADADSTATPHTTPRGHPQMERHTDAQLLVLAALARLTDPFGRAWLSRSSLADVTKLRRRELGRVLAQLVERGDLVEERWATWPSRHARCWRVVGVVDR